MKRKKIGVPEVEQGKKLLVDKHQEEISARVSTLVEAMELMKPIFQIKSGDGPNVLSFSDRFISAFNGYQCLSVEHNTKGFPGVSVDGDKLYRYLKDAKQSSFDFKIVKNQFVVDTKTYSFGLSYVEEETKVQQLVEGFRYEKKKWQPLSLDLLNALVLCSFYAAKEEWKGSLMGVYVNDHDVLSSDNHRISWYKIKEKMDRSFLMPSAGANILFSIRPTQYILEDEWIHFKGEGIFYSSVLMGEVFPKEAKDFFPKKVEKGFPLPKELEGTLEKVAIIQSEKKTLEQSVELKIKNGKLTVSSATERGWFKTEIDLPEKLKNRKMNLKINPVFLKQAMKNATQLYIVDDSKALFKSEDFMHLVVL